MCIMYCVLCTCCIFLGIDVILPDTQDVLQVTVHVLCGTCDLPAKALVQNFNQFNGAYGCGFCLQSGKSFLTEKGGNVRVFPFCPNSPDGPPRTKLSSIKDAEEAVRDHKVVSG